MNSKLQTLMETIDPQFPSIEYRAKAINGFLVVSSTAYPTISAYGLGVDNAIYCYNNKLYQAGILKAPDPSEFFHLCSFCTLNIHDITTMYYSHTTNTVGVIPPELKYHLNDISITFKPWIDGNKVNGNYHYLTSIKGKEIGE